MDSEQKTPSAETLRQLPYTELKRLARQRGIKANLKAEKLIAALISMDSDDTDSFSTPAAKMVNSSQKKKIEKFDEDSMTPLVTPRRGTYCIGSPIALAHNGSPHSSMANESSILDVSEGKRSGKKLRSCQQNEVLDSPQTNDLSVLDMSNVTVGRGSERKLRNRKQNDTSPSSVVNELSALDVSNMTASVANESSVLNISNVTVGRGSERKPRNRKVSFLSPVMTPHTPKNSNLKMRPKTPIVSRTPLDATISPFLLKDLKVNLGERVNESLHLTPMPEKFSNESSSKSTSFMNTLEVSAKKEKDAPKSTTFISTAEVSAKKQKDTPKSTSFINSAEVSAKKQKDTPSIKLTRSFINKSESKKKRLATPNFKKIHEKAFEKMESIEDYQKRIFNSAKKMGGLNLKANRVLKAKSKIPAFGGIPFIPSVSKSVTTKWDASTLTKSKQIEEKSKSNKSKSENLNTRSKKKFDLKASLSRKLGYKPYSGPLKPLTPSNLNTSSLCDHKNKVTPAKEPVNKVVTSNRMQSRSVLKGVRTNKRFELQMKNRLLQ